MKTTPKLKKKKKLGHSVAYLSRWRVKSQKNKVKFECGSIRNALEIVDRPLKIILSESHNNLLEAVIKYRKEAYV